MTEPINLRFGLFLSQAIFGHAANGEELRGLGHQGTHMDALGHFGFINQPEDTPT